MKLTTRQAVTGMGSKVLGFVPHFEVAEPGELDRLAPDQRSTNLEGSIHQIGDILTLQISFFEEFALKSITDADYAWAGKTSCANLGITVPKSTKS